MHPVKHVLLAITGAGLIFGVAGGRLTDLRAAAAGEPRPEVTEFEPGTLVGWGTLLIVLVFASDIGPTAPLAVAFAWLIFVMVALLFGPEAASKIGAMMGGAPTTVESSRGEPISGFRPTVV